MEELSTDGKYAITDEMRAQLADFYGNYASEEETAKTIKNYMRIPDISLIPIQQLRQVYTISIRRIPGIPRQRP